MKTKLKYTEDECMYFLSKDKPFPVIDFLKSNGVDVAELEKDFKLQKQLHEKHIKNGTQYTKEGHNYITELIYGKDGKSGSFMDLIIATINFFKQ